MLQAAADHMVTTVSEASRILGRDIVDVMILGLLVTSPGKLSVLGLADSLNIPRETCRRRVIQLRKDGWIQPRRLALVGLEASSHAERLCECAKMFTRRTERFAWDTALRLGPPPTEGATAASLAPLDVSPASR